MEKITKTQVKKIIHDKGAITLVMVPCKSPVTTDKRTFTSLEAFEAFVLKETEMYCSSKDGRYLSFYLFDVELPTLQQLKDTYDVQAEVYWATGKRKTGKSNIKRYVQQQREACAAIRRSIYTTWSEAAFQAKLQIADHIEALEEYLLEKYTRPIAEPGDYIYVDSPATTFGDYDRGSVCKVAYPGVADPDTFVYAWVIGKDVPYADDPYAVLGSFEYIILPVEERPLELDDYIVLLQPCGDYNAGEMPIVLDLDYFKDADYIIIGKVHPNLLKEEV